MLHYQILDFRFFRWYRVNFILFVGKQDKKNRVFDSSDKSTLYRYIILLF